MLDMLWRNSWGLNQAPDQKQVKSKTSGLDMSTSVSTGLPTPHKRQITAFENKPVKGICSPTYPSFLLHISPNLETFFLFFKGSFADSLFQPHLNVLYYRQWE